MVYVDNYQGVYRNMLMCHMVADTSEELMDMALKIGLKAEHIQFSRTGVEHFDLCLSKRKLAIRNGAKSITCLELIDIIRRKRQSERPIGEAHA